MTRNIALHRERRRWLVPVLTAAIVLVSAGPAAAAETIQGSAAGTGYSTINEVGTPEAPLCLQARRGAQYIIDDAPGAVVAAETMPDNSAEYVGPLDVTITLNESFYFSPAGTFSDSNCTMPKLVPATISVSSPDGSVSCSADDGVFSRVNTTIEFNEATEGTALDEECTVDDGATSVTVSPVTHAFVGNEYPCLTDPITMTSTCPGDVADNHVQGEWTVTAANP